MISESNDLEYEKSLIVGIKNILIKIIRKMIKVIKEFKIFLNKITSN